MKDVLNALRQFDPTDETQYQPHLFTLHHEEDRQTFGLLLKDNPGIRVHDRIEAQLYEWVKSEHPSLLGDPEKLQALTDKALAETDETYGVWVYYPWLNQVVHIVPEPIFTGIRTNRNQRKITADEQAILADKTVAVVGLSVGNAVAITLAMERVCGRLKLADFDELELSNLNRLRAGIHQTGMSKAVIIARQIAEIDPFIEVEIFPEGATRENLPELLGGNHPPDVLVEVCDSLDMKFALREACRDRGIPVVMDTNDRGLIDIERFDLEPERPFFHGRAEAWMNKELTHLTPTERLQLVKDIVGDRQLSERLQDSMSEIGKSLTSWPQLASGVMLGGAATTDVCRRILLNLLTSSGRFYIDFEELIQ